MVVGIVYLLIKENQIKNNKKFDFFSFACEKVTDLFVYQTKYFKFIKNMKIASKQKQSLLFESDKDLLFDTKITIFD